MGISFLHHLEMPAVAPEIKRVLMSAAFTRWQMKTFLEAFGFVEVRVLPFDFVHPFIPAVAIRSIEKLGNALESVPSLREIAGSLLISARLRK